jgi:hypothetical protein
MRNQKPWYEPGFYMVTSAGFEPATFSSAS